MTPDSPPPERICALIPAYNEATHISDVIARVRTHLPDTIVIDDGSTDDTAARAEAGGAEVVRNSPNLGKGRSLRRGLDLACERGYAAALTLDGDGQHLPEEIPLFLGVFRNGADLVVGNRMHDVAGMPWARLRTNQFTSWVVSRLAGTHLPDSQCGFRLIRCSAWMRLRDQIRTHDFDFESEILVQAARMGFRVEPVPISTVYGDEVSKINPVVDTFRFFRMALRLAIRQPSRNPPAQ